MLETASILAAYFAFALLHGARAERIPFQIAARLHARREWTAVARILSVVFLSLSVWLWRRTEPGPAALLVAFTAFLVAASLFVLLAPLWPRAVWALAVACLPAIAVLSLAGALGRG
jgi:hypothetical protein